MTALLRSTHEVETRVQEIYRYPSLLSTSAAHGGGHSRGIACEVLCGHSVTWYGSAGGIAAVEWRVIAMPQHAESSTSPMRDKWLLYRWWKLWKQDVREGWEILGRYRVDCTRAAALHGTRITFASVLALQNAARVSCE